MSILDIQSVTKQFGGLRAIDNISFSIAQQEIFGLIGPNGAGKTTLFNLITANLSATSGSIHLLKEDITSSKPNKIVRKGIARTFQNIRLFSSMSVLENILIGLHQSTSYNFFEAAFRVGRFFREEQRARQKAMEILAYIGIDSFAHQNAKFLSYGNQRKVEIARALATQPKLLLLDEPAAGMNPKETDELAKLIFKMRDDFKLTVLLIEHDMHFVNHLCDRVFVLDYGKKLFSGTPYEAISNKDVIAAYLGERNA